MRILLVEPDFPVANKSKNHNGFLPIGLLKLASYYRKAGHEIRLVRGLEDVDGFVPETILVTSLFTYWAIHVRACVQYYRHQFPHAQITVGGIYASLMPEHCKKYTECDRVFVGLHNDAERCQPAYDLVDTEHQIIHASRGCPRKCSFCGTWNIERYFVPKASIKREMIKRKLIFYDNNFLANPYIENILEELKATRVRGLPLTCECQSGLDGRILLQKPYLAQMLKTARFRYPRVAWDGSFDQFKEIKEQLDILRLAGFRPKDTYVFMLYNWNIPFDKMERKREKCEEWGVQIADCRFRPLNQIFDNYRPGGPGRVIQDGKAYYIHYPIWTDRKIRQFRKNIREHNIGIRFGGKYSHQREANGRLRHYGR